MKRSSAFYVCISTVLLGLAAVAAAKTHRFTSNLTRYYCTSIAVHAVCLPFAGTNVAFELGGNKRYLNLCTQGSTAAGLHTCASPGICKHPLTYNGVGE